MRHVLVQTELLFDMVAALADDLRGLRLTDEARDDHAVVELAFRARSILHIDLSHVRLRQFLSRH